MSSRPTHLGAGGYCQVSPRAIERRHAKPVTRSSNLAIDEQLRLELAVPQFQIHVAILRGLVDCWVNQDVILIPRVFCSAGLRGVGFLTLVLKGYLRRAARLSGSYIPPSQSTPTSQ